MYCQGQVAIVTGGASGLGRACVEALLAKQVKVAAWDKQVLDWRAKGLISCVCDVTEASSVEAALQETIAAVGSPRILIQCAGIIHASRLVGRTGPMSLEGFNTVISVNLTGTFNVMRLVAAHMMQLPVLEGGERGVIVNTASIAAFEGQIGQVAYSASKGGVVAMTLPAARELGAYAIRVNTIAPGVMATPMVKGMSAELQEKLAEAAVFPERLGEPAEFAQLAMHIVENAFLNGTVMRLDAAARLG